MRREFESGNVEPWPGTTNPDLASLITMVLLAKRPLLGPPPGEVLDAVPRDDYFRAILGDIDRLLEDLDWDTRNVMLTLARIWSTVATDFIRAKASWHGPLPNFLRNISSCSLVPVPSTWGKRTSPGKTSSRACVRARTIWSARSGDSLQLRRRTIRPAR
jgi:hypothetical protein